MKLLLYYSAGVNRADRARLRLRGYYNNGKRGSRSWSADAVALSRRRRRSVNCFSRTGNKRAPTPRQPTDRDRHGTDARRDGGRRRQNRLHRRPRRPATSVLVWRAFDGPQRPSIRPVASRVRRVLRCVRSVSRSRSSSNCTIITITELAPSFSVFRQNTSGDCDNRNIVIRFRFSVRFFSSRDRRPYMCVWRPLPLPIISISDATAVR